MTPMDRFWDKVDKSGECWVWTAYTDRGYGQIRIAGKLRKAHRVAYELVVGEIPEGMQLDHLCRNRSCVNPDHLEPVEPVVNSRRGDVGGHAQRAKTHCPQGHPYDQTNTYVTPVGKRQCRTCHRDKERQRRSNSLTERPSSQSREATL